jgi:hypothetical protein
MGTQPTTGPVGQPAKGKPGAGGKSLQEMFSKIQAQHRQRFGGQQVALKPTDQP